MTINPIRNRFPPTLTFFLWAIVFSGCDNHRRENGACINILRSIDGAKNQWAMEHNQNSNAVLTWEDIGAYIYTNDGIPSCPEGGVYTIGRAGEPPRCSIMSHNMGFGMICILDESGVPLADVRVVVKKGETELCSSQTETNGEAYIARDQIFTPDLWSDGFEKVVVEKAGYRNEEVSLPTVNWPIKLTLKKY
jgi:hypothetical protein